MKKIKFCAAVGVVVAAMFVGCATNSGMDVSSSESTKSEKPAKEKKAKAEKAPKQKKAKKQKFDQAGYDEAAKNGDYATCLGMIASELEANADKPKFELQIDQGLALYFQGDYAASAESLYNADLGLQEGSKDKNYWPSLFEAYTLEAISALSEYNNAENPDDGLENAMVRMRRLSEIQTVYDEYLEEIENAEKASDDPNSDSGKALATASQILGIDLVKIKDKKPKKGQLADRYSDSDFARLLSTYIREAYGESSSKFDIRFIKDKDVKEEAQAAFSIPSGNGRVEVFALSGTIAQKTPLVNEFPGYDLNGEPIILTLPLVDENGNVFDKFPLRFRFRWPGIEKDKNGGIVSNSEITSVEISVDGTTKTAILVEDFDESLRKDVEYFARANYSKNVAAVIAAKSSAAVGGMATVTAAYMTAREAVNAGVPEAMAMKAYIKARDGLAVAIDEVDMKISPNCEQVKLIPSKASVAGFDVPAGNHEIVISYKNGDSVVYSEKKTVNVEAGKPAIIESHCAK